MTTSRAIHEAFLMMLLLAPLPVAAQTGSVRGVVTSSTDGRPVSGAQIRLRSPAGPDVAAVSDAEGRFRMTAAPGRYVLIVLRIGYEAQRIEDIVVRSGQAVDQPVRLTPVTVILDPLVVSPSRTEERALQAPTATSVVREETIDGRVATNIADHVLSVPGVDAAETGMMRTALVTRGFNDVFSTSLLVLTDNRYASVPSNRLNALYMIPTTDLDVERVEVSLGPASALYGPNATNGVMHLITKSPIDRPGTTVTVGGGERATFQGMFRTAWASPGRKFGAKISGQFFTGDDWKWIDPAEAAAAAANPGNANIGAAVFKAQRWSAEARLDYRPDRQTELSLTAGSNTTLKQVEVSGAGRSMADGWRYSFVQARLNRGRLFAQAYLNFSDAGESYQLRTGLPFVDNSRMWVGQLQHGLRAFGSDLTYGLDLQSTDTRSGGTITGRYEDDDRVDEVGAYLQSVTSLSARFQAVGALRIDYHNRLEDPVWSPRIGIIFRPASGHTLRATFNRAFRTPSVLELFLDLKAGAIPIAPGFGYDIRAVGVGERGYTFTQCAGGVGGFCMRVPGNGAAQLPADATLLWDQFIQALVPDLAPLLPNPGASVGSVLRRFSPAGAATGDPFPLDPLGPTPVAPLRPRIDNTFELGYKGLIGGQFLLSGNVYYQRIKDFVGPIGVESPNVFLDPATTAAYVNARLRPLVDGGQMTQQDVDALVTGLVSIPMGTVSPAEWDAADILLSYRNVGDVNLWGFEAGADYVVSPSVTLGGSVSFASKNCFDLDQDGACASPVDRAMNAPRWKGHLNAQLTGEASGLSGQARVRFISGFPQSAGVFVGDVNGYTLVDASLGYRFKRLPNVTAVLTASNLLGSLHRPMIGAPEIGRLTMLRLRYDF